jgi:uncharacterized spore protein YtfJ
VEVEVVELIQMMVQEDLHQVVEEVEEMLQVVQEIKEPITLEEVVVAEQAEIVL